MRTASHSPSGVLRASLTAAVLLLPAALAGCRLLDPGAQRDRAELERAWRLWEAHGIEHYQYVQQRLCYCANEATSPVIVTVFEGRVASRRYLEDNAPVPVEYVALWGSVPDLFRLIEQALDSQAASLLVSYHPQLGYPSHIAIDYRHTVADDEITVTAAAFNILPDVGLAR